MVNVIKDRDGKKKKEKAEQTAMEEAAKFAAVVLYGLAAVFSAFYITRLFTIADTQDSFSIYAFISW